MTGRFSSGTLELLSDPPRSSSRYVTRTKLLGTLLGIFIITTIVFASFYGVEKARKASTTTATVVPIISTTALPTTSPTQAPTAATTEATTISTTVAPITTATIESTTTATLGSTTTTTVASTTSKSDQSLCLTPYCVKAADYLIESIDETVEPCEDFFNFVCGTWIKNTRIPDDAGAVNTFNVLETQLDNNVVDILSSPLDTDANDSIAVNNAQILYKSCINEALIDSDGVEPILSLINTEFGGWPILQGPTWNNSTFDLFTLLKNLQRYNYNIFFRIGTSTDEKNSSNYDIEIGQGGLGLGQRQYYANETSITVAYRRFMQDLAIALGNNQSWITDDVNDIFEFEKTISEYSWTIAEQRERDNETVRTTIGNLSLTLNTTFNFTEYAYQAYELGNVTLLDSDIIFVHELEYLLNISTVLAETPPRTLQNYVIWRFIMNRVSDMPQEYRIFRDRFERIFRGTSAEPPRTILCGRYVNDKMGFAVSKLYINRYFDATARNQSFDMIDTIQASFIDMLNQNTWMDVGSRNLAIEKAKAIDRKIGYPDYLSGNNNTKLDEDYAEYIFNESYVRNVLKLLQINSKENFQTLRKTVDRKAWGDTAPSIVNAFYDPSRNQITFPAGILQKPFFDKDAPKYLNYGGIGVVIGHEITHGFDDEGRQFDKDGNRVPWWTNETISNFNDRKTCIVNQYSNYTVTQVNMKSNGFQTQGEDIADNGGLRESFFAYQKWAAENPNLDKRLPGLQNYSPEQMFFINYAHTWCIKMTDSYAVARLRTDVHSLGQFRAIGPPSNFDQFDRAFGCTPGQGSSRKDKCIVW